MKKILLSAVLCGFVLNNGYCFDEEHKITEDDITPIIELMEKRQYLENLREPIGDMVLKHSNEVIKMHDDKYVSMLDIMPQKLKESVEKFLREEKLDVECQIRKYLREFGNKVLTSKAPSEEHPERNVNDLLRCCQLRDSILQTMCDDSVNCKIECSIVYGSEGFTTFSADITFFFSHGTEINVRVWPALWDYTVSIQDYTVGIQDPSFGTLDWYKWHPPFKY